MPTLEFPEFLKHPPSTDLARLLTHRWRSIMFYSYTNFNYAGKFLHSDFEEKSISTFNRNCFSLFHTVFLCVNHSLSLHCVFIYYWYFVGMFFMRLNKHVATMLVVRRKIRLYSFSFFFSSIGLPQFLFRFYLLTCAHLTPDFRLTIQNIQNTHTEK